MLGALVNAVAVTIGSTVGLILSRYFSGSLREKLLLMIGLFTVYLAVKMMLEAGREVSLILGLLTGTLVGHCLGLERRLEDLASKLNERVSMDSKLVDGLLTPFLTFCIGPMTLVGSLRDGMGDPSIILAKSVMDGFSSIAFASTFGISVLLSSIPLLIFQGSLATLGRLLGESLPQTTISDITGTGGVILLALAVRIIGIRRVEVSDMLPSLLLVPLISSVINM
ncbi:MAG: DUF554 domain-containing protein [Candidatus Korarchaeum sp.]|nr:DUF554 domain-containing protein [Candidatus Korarchaeum sp.]MDW8035425.1 DUF554 domain-containing protein [Candidatus Korarchaeum sp.]